MSFVTKPAFHCSAEKASEAQRPPLLPPTPVLFLAAVPIDQAVTHFSRPCAPSLRPVLAEAPAVIPPFFLFWDVSQGLGRLGHRLSILTWGGPGNPWGAAVFQSAPGPRAQRGRRRLSCSGFLNSSFIFQLGQQAGLRHSNPALWRQQVLLGQTAPPARTPAGLRRFHHPNIYVCTGAPSLFALLCQA